MSASGALLALTDVTLAEIREHCGAAGLSKAEKAAARDAMRALAETGEWRGGTRAEAFDPAADPGAVARRSPDVFREEAGDASAWLLPMALPSDVALDGWMREREGGGGGPAGDDDEKGLAEPSPPPPLAAADALADDAIGAPPTAPTPAALARLVSGRAAPLLSADPEVLRPEALARADETAGRRGDGFFDAGSLGEAEVGSPEYDFRRERQAVGKKFRELKGEMSGTTLPCTTRTTRSGGCATRATGNGARRGSRRSRRRSPTRGSAPTRWRACASTRSTRTCSRGRRSTAVTTPASSRGSSSSTFEGKSFLRGRLSGW